MYNPTRKQQQHSMEIEFLFNYGFLCGGGRLYFFHNFIYAEGLGELV